MTGIASPASPRRLVCASLTTLCVLAACQESTEATAPRDLPPRTITGANTTSAPSTSVALTSSLGTGAVATFVSLSPGMDRANGINDAGLVVGDHGGNNIATTWTAGGGYHEVRRLDGSTACCSGLNDVNASGDAAGWSHTDVGVSSMVWSQATDTKTDLLVPRRAYASSLNDGGDVVGYHFDLGYPFVAYFKPNGGVPVTLAQLPGTVNAYAWGTNNARVIVGENQLGPEMGYANHAVVWSTPSATPTDLGTLGGPNSHAYGVNQVGDVVGAAETATGEKHAMLWTPGSGMVDLATWPNSCQGQSEARSVNDLGIIVGTCNGGPVYWTAIQGMRSLPLPANVTQGIAVAINNKYQVVGIYNGFGGALWTITVPNAPPVLTSLVLPGSPIALGAAAVVTATFTDPDAGDSHTAVFDWGDGQTSTATPNPDGSVGSISISHVYQATGVYAVSATVTDNGGLSASLSSAASTTITYVVVYDPTAGFVTGGGWIVSPAGAYVAQPTSTGRASFGFVAKYQRGASLPSGNTQFDFTAGQLGFKSTSYEWLVVGGARAQFKGTGTINGAGVYKFMLTAVDGQFTGGGGADRFRIKIWDAATGAVVYDNEAGAPDDAPPATSLGGGSIVIHQ